MANEIVKTIENGVLRLTFNRPDRKNAITSAMYAALADGLAEAEESSSVRAVLFDSAADVFTAGNDIGDFMAGESLSDPHATPPVMRFLLGLATATKPLVAAVNGPAVGVGLTMLLHCDLVFASENATFAAPFVDLGLVPEAASSLLLPAFAGHHRAAELMLAGKRISAVRAMECGFVNVVVAPDELAALATKEAEALAAKAPTAMRLAKQLMKGDRETLVARMKEEAVHFAAQLKSAEFQEAGIAFMQKRKPDFSKLG
jgi:enoyl-CoA hydratase/carnithine racemase